MELVSALAALTQLMMQVETMASAAHRLSGLIQDAQAEGRDITEEELDELLAEDDRARDVLQRAIDSAEE